MSERSESDTGNGVAAQEWLIRAALPAALVLLAFVGVYLLSGYAQPPGLSAFGRTYILYPVLWLCLALCVAFVSSQGASGRVLYTKRLLWAALLVGAFQVACLLIAGLFSHFGRSPYAHTTYHVFRNTCFFASTLVGMEFARSYLLNTFAGRRGNLMVIPLTLMFALLSLPLTRLTNGELLSLPFIYSICLPLIARSLVASYLAMATRGPLASIAYLGVLLAFEWYSPILPNLSWTLNSFVGTLAAVVGLLAVQSFQETNMSAAAEVNTKRSSLAGWVLVAVMCVTIVFISFGALGVRPMVVGSGSMGPALNVGDIAVVKAVSADSVGEGDVIQFVRDGSVTIHRVVEVRDESPRSFVTQGDANDSPDSTPVYPQQIQGKVIFRIPKAGWMAIGIRRLLS